MERLHQEKSGITLAGLTHKALLLLTLTLLALPTDTQAETTWHWEKGTIVVDTPPRPAGQQPALNLATPALPIVRVAFVGLGNRGPYAVERWTHINGVRIVALCDHEKERAEKCQKFLTQAGLPEADIYYGAEGYKQLCEREDVNLIYVATDWEHHVPVAKYALEHGKHAAVEVPAALTLQDCWELIDLAEQKRLHCMILENCCYDFFEMNTLNMAQHGLFGDILHVEGAYLHSLWHWTNYWHNWRLKYNKEHRGDIYPTHGLGPVAQLLNIHRGDRFKNIVAMDTKPATGPIAVKEYPQDLDQLDAPYRNGDHTTTLISTVGGKVIEIQHDVMNPQPYNRRYQLTGTKGYANKYPTEGYALSAAQMKAAGVETQGSSKLTGHEFMGKEEFDALVAKYQSPIVTKYQKIAREVGGHGGMDFIMESRLVYCLQNGLPLDIDVYDMAEWCCLAELGALSMDNDNAAVRVPDFTRGHWNDQQGFRHAFAPAEQEVVSDSIARHYTHTLKAQGPKAAEKALSKLLKQLNKGILK
ncbi:MAG: Gfo/Idh/MocA family oxidoreductase [Bacteroidaceae bacterium]|nr:Gfo/Idh/MocA family oxidoreductase [Bacteroidaceae bacterium]